MKNFAPALENPRVRLEQLEELNYQKLREIAKEPGLTQFSPGDIESDDGFHRYFRTAQQQQQSGSSHVYLVFDKQRQAYAGTTRFMRIDPKNKILEIGATWIGTSFQGTGLNTAMKSLMLEEAFTRMGFEKVAFRIDERNQRSRKAVEKLGAHLEGILRADVYLEDGYKRNTCLYGLFPHR